ncbi:Chromosome segregation protein sudA [Ceratocystis platani]|uniref:Structural maintenance of chromosomes protein n=1 Tax=Ceratocystis fimbriata f. sp. platani TaxID=88771 RepID=A0A0F8DF12_CERFI|nr:Chromosome segregation protein sudA [Ceratocystis platani]
MYIKQIIIQGFKSYKEQIVIEPFSPGTNVIVGRNGAGKSNFFAAIRFVLSDAYTQMSREERQALLHEGSGAAVMSAYVEIIFDNSDDRFPTGHPEVVLRRTIGLKKDEYSVDRKVVTKSDVVNLLEAAGFSRSNPYYIVPQGRVTALTNMKESDRLNLLKEVAGTQVYEARRTESLKIMHDTNNKREKIDELLKYIDERLKELEEEKEELRGFQDKDRERRCLEYAFFHSEQVELQESLDQIERIRDQGKDVTDESRQAFIQGEKAIAQMETEIHRLNREIDLLKIDKRQLEEDRRDTSKALAKAELSTKTLIDSQSIEQAARNQQAAQLAAISQEIATKEKELNNIIPEYTRRREAEEKTRQNLDAADIARSRLLTKQSRSSQFRNKAERDGWLNKEIQDLSLNINSQKAHRTEADEEVARITQTISELENQVDDLRKSLNGWGDERNARYEQLAQARDVVDKLEDTRRQVRREDDKLESILADARNERENAERELSQSMDGATARGLATIRRLKLERDIPGAYGTLSELLEVPDAYRLPVEQVAGASLFHYVVDTSDTASQLMEILQSQKGGRVTFMPLDRLKPRRIDMPRTADAIPIISKIKYDAKYDKAFQQVFGRTILCPNLNIAGQYARSHHVDGITMDGDTTSKRGAMTGGYVDPRKSRLETVKAVGKWRDEYDRLLAQSEDTHRQIEQLDQEISQAMGDLRKAEQNLGQMDRGLEPLRNNLASHVNQLEMQRNQLDEAIKRRDRMERNLQEFIGNLEAHQAELASDFKKALTNEEERQLQKLEEDVVQLQKEWNETSMRRRELETRKQALEIDLRHKLQPSLDQLTSMVFESASATTGGAGSVEEAQRELKKLQKQSATTEKTLQSTLRQLDDLQTKVKEIEHQKAEQERSQHDIAAQLERHQKKIDKSLHRKAMLTQQLSDCAKNIRDLGVLPEEAFEKYESMETKTITSRLKRVNEALKKYKHVNKKAFEQYNSFTQQQDQLMKRRKELEASQASIEELVAHLDQRKDEAIERTFKQVSKEFATIFEKLVPAGHGRLVIQRRADRRKEDAEESDVENRGMVENYTGVGISVSFNSKQFDEQQRIQQLSGGQKSLCALCLIFALQQTESSPMVIFDEVDANLDAQYRTAVAALLQSISTDAGTQFICTTFRPEIVHTADKAYGVLFRNKTSSIDCVTTEEALSFVEGQKS